MPPKVAAPAAPALPRAHRSYALTFISRCNNPCKIELNKNKNTHDGKRSESSCNARRIPCPSPARSLPSTPLPPPALLLLANVRRIAGRIAHAIAESNDRRAKREIARFVALNGGFFTDDVERRIGERMSRF